MIEKQMKLAPLTASQSRDILALKSAYGSFWRDPRFTKGYVEPRFHRSDVEPYLSKAAEYVVRIRSHLDSLTDVPPQEKKRVISGFANEFLFNQELFSPEKGRKSGDYSHPSDDPKKFVRDLVHSTLMDTHGYVEGLDEPTVDDLISQIDTYLQESQHSSDLSDGHLLFDSLVSRWDRNAQLFSMAFGDASENQQLFSDLSTINEMKTLEALLSQTEETLRAIRLNRLRITRSPFLDAPGTPFPTHTSIQDHLQPPEASVRDDGDHDHDYRDEQRLSLQSDDCHHNVETSSSTLPESAESAQEPDSSSACRDDEGSTIDSAAPEAPSHPTLTEPSTASPEAESSPSDASSPTSSSVVDDEHAQNESDTKQDETVDDDSADLKASYIQIQKVAEHVDQVASEFKDVLIHVEPLCSDTNALEQHPIESLKSIEKFHSTLIGYNEELLQDLIRLDDIEVDPVVRQERKKQVVAIQSLMDDLDAISSKLKKLKDVLKPQVDRIRAEQSPSPEAPSSPAASPPSASRTESPNHHHAPGRDASASPPPQSSSPKAHPSSSSSSPSSSTSSDSPLTSLWHKMKMELQWDKSQTADAYIIRTMIPGLDTKHTKIELAEDNSAFSISGLRVPTQREEAELRRSLRMRYRYPPSEEDRLLMQLVAGKYGSFKSTFGLPKDAIVDRISASYERGILQVTVPRRPIPQHVPTYFQPRAQSSRRAPNPRGFWGDRDLWWQ